MSKVRVGVFFDGFEPFHEYKCSGQIVAGLRDLGVEVALVTLKKPILAKYNPPFPVVQISSWEEIVELNIDRFILYTWLSPTYNKLVKLLKESGKKVIIKADSDGRIGASVEPRPCFWKSRFLFAPPLWKVPFRFFLATQKWRDLRKVEQISMADSVVLESPDAASNVAFFLSNLGYQGLIGKIRVIPNPVTPDITRTAIPRKENIVTSVGRWGDWLQKNPGLLAGVLSRFLSEVDGWRAVIIGDGRRIPEKGSERFCKGWKS